MAEIQEILDVLDDIKRQVADIEERIVIGGAQVSVVEGLSDISDSLGLVSAGEFRSGKGIPGKGFSGVRVGWPGFVYGGVTYNIVGVDNDTMQFALRASDGVAEFIGGDAVIGKKGLQLTGSTDVGGSVDNKYITWFEDGTSLPSAATGPVYIGGILAPSTGDQPISWLRVGTHTQSTDGYARVEIMNRAHNGQFAELRTETWGSTSSRNPYMTLYCSDTGFVGGARETGFCWSPTGVVYGVIPSSTDYPAFAFSVQSPSTDYGGDLSFRNMNGQVPVYGVFRVHANKGAESVGMFQRSWQGGQQGYGGMPSTNRKETFYFGAGGSPPTTDYLPTDGIIMFVDGGRLKYLSSDGTIYTV